VITPPPIKEHLESRCLEYRKGVFHLSRGDLYKKREGVYIKVREKEGRIYPDTVLKNLPAVDRSHPLHHEWKIRESSMKKLIHHLRGKKGAFHLLDLGCGNGWMSRHLAEIPGWEVFALDLNEPELSQGARAFSDDPHLTFSYGNIFEDIFPPACFDVILMAGTIQYFPEPVKLINCLFKFLKKGGEVHILDSPFYNHRTVSAARERTKQHYKDLAIPDMTSYYYHHLFSSLKDFRPNLPYNPKAPIQRFKRKFLNCCLSPFPWIQIKSEKDGFNLVL